VLADVKTLVVSAGRREDGNSHIRARPSRGPLGSCHGCRRIEDGNCSPDDR